MSGSVEVDVEVYTSMIGDGLEVDWLGRWVFSCSYRSFLSYVFCNRR